MKKLKSFLTVLLMSTMTVYSQTPVQWQRMLQLEGYWEGPVTLTLGTQVFHVNYHSDFKTIIDDLAMTMDEGFADPALGELKGANLIGLNSADGLIHWFSADNFGTAHEHIGAFTNQKHLYIENNTLTGGQQYIERINITLRPNNKKVDIYLVATLGPDTVEILEGTLTKRHHPHRLSISNPDETIEVNVFPNPGHGEFEISASEKISEICITDEKGQIVSRLNPDETDFTIQLSNSGVYYFTVFSENKKSQTKKMSVVE
jgi:hypothetical protein